MTSLSIHEIRKMELSEINDLQKIEPIRVQPSYTRTIKITYVPNKYKSNETETISIVLFSSIKSKLQFNKLVR